MQKPHVVERATRWADSLGFTRSCRDEVGALLHVLAGSIPCGRIADIGTGCGVGTAWIASATDVDIFTIDNDLSRAEGIGNLFTRYNQVHLMVGEWKDILQHGPFRLVFVDVQPAKVEGIDALVQATEVGGILVLDDLTPIEFWPKDWKGRPDPVREAWLNHPVLASTEIRTSLENSAILACRMA